MKRVDTILAEYNSADEAERLFLFLSHRDLRDIFMKMDRAQSRQAQEACATKPDRSWINRFFNCCPGFFRP